MKTRNLTLLIIVAVILLLGGCGCGGYNNMVKLDENVKAKWSNVESNYKRRSDLIKNLVSVVKRASNFEQETLTKVIEARAKATSVNISASDLSPEKIQQFEQAQQQLGSSLSRLLVVAERYPELKSLDNFGSLQAEIAGTENRINVARIDFNTAIQQYNSTVRKFPNNLFAGMFGFQVKQGFQANPEDAEAPDVDAQFEK